MRRALPAGLALGVAAGLLFVFHDSLALSVAWPIILGFALWETVGMRGARGAIAGLAAALGALVGYATFALVTELLPITATGFGIGVGIAVAVLVLVGLMMRERLPVSGLLIGYGSFLAMFEPRWQEAAASIRIHGLSDLTVTVLGLLVGVLAATLVRAVINGSVEAEEEELERAEARGAPIGDVAMRGEGS
jgi:uncharacterized membrane protein YqhA